MQIVFLEVKRTSLGGEPPSAIKVALNVFYYQVNVMRPTENRRRF